MQTRNRIYLQFLFFGFFIVFSSWIRWYSTGSLRADDNFVKESLFHTWTFFLSYCIGFGGMLYTYFHIVFNKKNYILNVLDTKKLAFLSSGLFFFMSVMFASDIYTYLAEGELATRGIYTYTNGELVKESAFIDYVSLWWKDCPNHYGPPLLLLFASAVSIGKSLFMSYVVFKLLMLIVSFCLIEVVYRIFVEIKLTQTYNVFALIVLGPIILIEGVGQAHVEIIISLLLALSILFFLRNKILIAIFFIALAMACKVMYSMILLPFMIAFVYVKYFNIEKNSSKFVQYILISIFLSCVIVAISYIPVWEGLSTVMNPMDYHKTKTPSRSFTEIFIFVYHYGKELIQNEFSISKLIENAHNSNFLTKAMVLDYQNKIAPIFKLIGVLLSGWCLLPLLKSQKTMDVFHVFAKVWIVIITFYSPIFNPWYFMPILILLFGSDKKSWMIYAIVTMSFTINPQLSNSIPAGHIAEVILSINLLCFPILFLLFFKENFILETWRNIRK